MKYRTVEMYKKRLYASKDIVNTISHGNKECLDCFDRHEELIANIFKDYTVFINEIAMHYMNNINVTRYVTDATNDSDDISVKEINLNKNVCRMKGVFLNLSTLFTSCVVAGVTAEELKEQLLKFINQELREN